MNQLNFGDFETRVAVCDTMKQEINKYCETKATKHYRKHLGASQIGDSCSRKLFYSFRWATEEQLATGLDDWEPGQMGRLLERGDDEEPKAVEYLQSIGCQVWPKDPNTGEQWKFSNLEGHFEGSIDGFLYLPPQFQYNKLLTLSVKTANRKNFTQLVKGESVKHWKPVYYYQESTYALQFETEFALYYVANKDNDDIYLELVPMVKHDGEMMVRKATDIINCDPQMPPQRIAMRATDFNCKYCLHKKVCHYDEPVRKNCRSCIFSRPGPNKSWICGHQDHAGEIQDNLIQIGCDDHVGIK